MAIPIWKTFPFGDFPSIPKWAQTLFGNGIVTEPVPIWKQGRVNPCFCMGVPTWKRGAILFDPHMEMRTPHFHMGICHSPFPCGDTRMWSPYGNGLFPFPYGEVSIPISILRFPYGNGEPFLMIPHIETGIPHFHMGMCQSLFPYGNPFMETGSHGHSPFPYREVSTHVSIWGSLYGNGKPFLIIPHMMETGIPHFHMVMCQSSFPYGDPCMETGSR